MEEEYKLIDVDKISFDTENPRIKKALEKYGDSINAERINFALRSSSDESSSSSSFTSLRNSIRTNGRVTQPITVVENSDGLICIDGNTRLAIYKEFKKEKTEGIWDVIPSLLIKNPSKRRIETIRVSAHLVGARPWPAYEKARYLHYLYHQELMDYRDMIALCGGNEKEIERQVDAYEDMNSYYRDLVDDTAFHIDRFSGFVELQKSGVKEAIFEEGLELENFGEWIRDGKIRRLQDVRDLPRVLRNDECKQIFLDGGVGSIETAKKHLEKLAWKETQIDANKTSLNDASTELLAQALINRITEMPFSTIQSLNTSDSGAETLAVLDELKARLSELLDYVGK
jgi:ParB-like chromosome segregation protein Spo0J